LKCKYFILVIIFILIFSSCDRSENDYIFKFAIEGNPSTLDPQCAENDSSESVFPFVFEGLFRFGENGEIEKGMIDDYDISEDGKKWTFYLKSGIFWSDGENFTAECTADDFVFAFRRLLRPETKSGRAGEYYILKNAEKINKGKLTDISQLGIRSIDKYTLEIILENPCSDFKALLSLPPAMPCNEEFFESTQGRYGLAGNCVASNSGYYVHTWNYDEWSDEGNYIILRRNKMNHYSESSPYSVNLFIDLLNERKEFEEEVLKVYKCTDSEEIGELKKHYNYSEYKTAVWGIIFNLNSEFSNQNYRLELADTVDFSFSEEHYDVFSGIIPFSVYLGEEHYRDSAGDVESVTGSSDNVGALSGIRMIMPDKPGLRKDIGRLLQGWQSECGFYCGITELKTDDYNRALKNGDFDIAIVRLSGEYNSPYAYLNDFLADNSENFSGYKSNKYNHIINSAITSADNESAAVFYKEAEQLLIDSGVFIPLCIETEYIFYEDDNEGIFYNPFSGVYSTEK